MMVRREHTMADGGEGTWKKMVITGQGWGKEPQNLGLVPIDAVPLWTS